MHAYGATGNVDNRAWGAKKRGAGWGLGLEAESPKELGIINSNVNLRYEYTFVKGGGRTYL